MLSTILLAAAAVTSPAKSEPSAMAVCQNASVEMAAANPHARVRKLNELPNANLVLGVLRSENGCQKPVIVRYDIGSGRKGR